jgi:hypothetical protein
VLDPQTFPPNHRHYPKARTGLAPRLITGHVERACIQVLRSVSSDPRRCTEQSLLHDVAVVGPRLYAANDPEDIYREIKINCKSPTTPFQIRVPRPKPIKGAQFLTVSPAHAAAGIRREADAKPRSYQQNLARKPTSCKPPQHRAPHRRRLLFSSPLYFYAFSSCCSFDTRSLNPVVAF